MILRFNTDRGWKHKAEDALSHIFSPIELTGTALTFLHILDVKLIGTQVESNPKLSKLKRGLQDGPDAHPWYSVEQGRLLYQGDL